MAADGAWRAGKPAGARCLISASLGDQRVGFLAGDVCAISRKLDRGLRCGYWCSRAGERAQCTKVDLEILYLRHCD
jgi:hypothetical protein